MKKTKKSTVYQTPKVTVVAFTIEQGFAATKSIGSGTDNGTEQFIEDNPTATRSTNGGWSNGEYF